MTVGSARKRRIHKSGVLIVISLGAIFAGFPVFWMFVNSFKPNSEIFAFPPKIVSPNFTFDAYFEIFKKFRSIQYQAQKKTSSSWS